jgi:hypothetical protein
MTERQDEKAKLSHLSRWVQVAAKELKGTVCASDLACNTNISNSKQFRKFEAPP